MKKKNKEIEKCCIYCGFPQNKSAMIKWLKKQGLHSLAKAYKILTPYEKT